MSKLYRQKNQRNAEVKRAEKKLGKHALTALEMKSNLTQEKVDQNLSIRRRVSRGRVVRHQRPLQEVKVNQYMQPKLLLDMPNVGSKMSMVYPTPKWFENTSETIDVSVIIPLYKSHIVIQDLIDSWDLVNDELNVEIIYVDDNCPNNSRDKVVQYWQSRKHQIRNGIGKIIYNSQNKGYGGACNTGADFARGKYIIYLNADTRVTGGWIKPIVDLFEDPTVGIVGNLQLKDGGEWHDTIDSAGSQWLWDHGSFIHIGRHCRNGKTLPKPYRVDEAPDDIMQVAEREMVTGCCLAIRSDLNKKIGGFNPNFRIGYWEDSDLCLTVREKGWKIMFQPNSVIYHKLGHTNSGQHAHHNFNQSFFWNKWVKSKRIDSLVSGTGPLREVNHILIQRRAASGDVLMASYLASALKKKYPGVKISFYTNCPDVLENHPYIDKVYTEIQFSERQFQLIYNLDMVYEHRPHTHVLESYADVVGVKVEDCDFSMGVSHCDGFDAQKFVVMHPGRTNWVGRDWRIDYFELVAQHLMQEGYAIVLVGNTSDRSVTCSLDLRGKTSVSQMAYVIGKADLFIGIDSMPFHVAQSVNTPGVCYFGSILPELRIYRDNMKGVNAKIPCIGCHHRKMRPSIGTTVCETGDLACEKLSFETFWNQVQSLITPS